MAQNSAHWTVVSSGRNNTKVEKLQLKRGEECRDGNGAVKDHLDSYPIGSGVCGRKTCLSYSGAGVKYEIVRKCRQISKNQIADKINCRIRNNNGKHPFPDCCPYVECQESTVILPTIDPTSCEDTASAKSCTIWKKIHKCK